MLEITAGEELELGEGIVLHSIPELDKYWAFNIISGDQYELNDSAFFLLSQFARTATLGGGLKAFSEQYKVDERTTETDCLPVIEHYLEAGVVKRR